jgi:hypothetical protein
MRNTMKDLIKKVSDKYMSKQSAQWYRTFAAHPDSKASSDTMDHIKQLFKDGKISVHVDGDTGEVKFSISNIHDTRFVTRESKKLSEAHKLYEDMKAKGWDKMPDPQDRLSKGNLQKLFQMYLTNNLAQANVLIEDLEAEGQFARYFESYYRRLLSYIN